MVADLVAWVCHTPLRLAATVGTVILLVVAGGTLLGGAGGGGETARPAPTVSAAAPDPTPYVTTAVDFVEEWARLRPGEDADAWHDRIEPLVTQELGQALALTDPAQLPDAAPEGTPSVRFVSQSSGLIAVPLDNGSSVVVTVVDDGGSWLVSDVQPDVGDAGDVGGGS